MYLWLRNLGNAPLCSTCRLAEMKNLVKEKRQHREEVEEIKAQVTKMSKEALAVQFKEWTQDAGGSMPLALVNWARTRVPVFN